MTPKPKDEKIEYEALLAEARRLTRSTEVPASEEDFSLEDILAEYGGSRGQQILREAAAEAGLSEAPPPPEPKAAQSPPETETAPDGPEPEKTPEEERPSAQAEKPRPTVTMEDVVGRTVDAVQETQRERQQERRQTEGRLSKRRRRRPSRKARTPEPPRNPPEAGPVPEPETKEEIIGPEPPLSDAAAEARRDSRRRGRRVPLSVAATVFLAVLLTLDQRGDPIPLWTGDLGVQTAVQLFCLAVAALCCRDVFARAFRLLARRRWSGDLVAVLAAAVSGLDCAARMLSADRADAMPYVLPACAALTAAQWGLARRDRGRHDTYRTASITDEPPYLVTDTLQGACKQRGRVEGFYTDAERDDLPLLWQTALVPVILMGTLVFAGLSSLGQGRNGDFLLCWSATLSGAASLGLPLAWSLPWSRMAARLQKSGCAIAGWGGASAISKRRAAILTGADLFPPGAVRLNGIKVYGEAVPHAASYAASLIRASNCGLTRLFDELVRGDGGRYCQVDDFRFYKEGGFAGTIRGETVLLGTASFMNKMNVRLPEKLKLHTGLFLSVDGTLQAVFAVRYDPEENVDWALRLLKRNRVASILASRDPNITPALIKRKFYRGARLEYPTLELRLALSEQESGRGRPRALLLREGLLPYAETVIGAWRLRRSVQDCALLSLLGSVCGTLLTFYLAFQGAFAQMPPATLLAFSALWAVPVLLVSVWTAWF